MLHNDLEYWLWFTAALGAANPGKWNVLSHYGDIGTVYERLSSGDMENVLPKDKRSVQSVREENILKTIELCFEKNISIVHYEDPAYPDRLKEIYNPPSVLFVQGSIGNLDKEIVVTVVGTRHPSEYSVSVSRRICGDLAKNGVTIASGFAVGLDSVAHRSAIDAGGRTYAVLPCGHLYPYPPENADSKSLVAEHGAVISEYFPNDRPSTLSFRARNRLLSGISLGTLVLQAGIKSGALSTASFAVSQGRDIFCLPPHELFNAEYSGVCGLLRDGAIAVFDASDVLNEYLGLYPRRKPSEPRVVYASATVQDKPEIKKTVKTDMSLGDRKDAKTVSPNGLKGLKKDLFEYIRDKGEVHLDRVVEDIKGGLETEALLTELELDGLIKSLPGNRFSL